MTIKRIEDLGYCTECKGKDKVARAKARDKVIKNILEEELSAYDAGVLLANCSECYDKRNSCSMPKTQYVPEPETAANYLI